MSSTQPTEKKISSWEWLPFAVVLLLAVGYFTLKDGGSGQRFCLLVGLGLLPGCLWRLLGNSSWGVHRIGFAVGLVVYVLDNPDLWPGAAVLERITSAWPVVLIGIAVAATQPFWGALRLGRLMHDSGLRMSFVETFKLCLSGHFFNIFLPGATGGDLYRLYAITRGDKRKFAPALASITLDRFLGLPPLVLMVFAAAFIEREFAFRHEKLSGLLIFVALAAALCLILMLLIWLGRKKDTDTSKTGLMGKLHRVHRLLSVGISRTWTLPIVLWWGLLSHMAVAGACCLFGMAVGVEGITVAQYFLLVPLAMCINAIPGAPGGVGQGEIAMAALFELASPGHGNSQAGVAVMLLLRIANTMIGLAGGALYATGKIDLREVEYRSAELGGQRDNAP